jgi:hypothetical protein
VMSCELQAMREVIGTHTISAATGRYHSRGIICAGGQFVYESCHWRDA